MKTEVRDFAAIILAAGQGRRMGSALPKVLHQIGDKAMVEWVIKAARDAGATRIVVVVGFGRDQVTSALPKDIEIAVQERQLGTGHAARCAEPQLRDWNGPIAVLCGDVPLIRSETIAELVALHSSKEIALSLLTTQPPETGTTGRVVRDKDGRIRKVVEPRDATPEELQMTEINSGNYVFGPGKLFPALTGLEPRRKEFRLADCVSYYTHRNETVAGVKVTCAQEVMSINTPKELAAAERLLLERVREAPPEALLSNEIRLLTGNGNPKLAADICAYLRVPPANADIGRFPDGETKVQILDDVRGRDVFIIQPTSPPVNDNLFELLTLIDAAKRSSAERITAVIPYFGYARQDRKHAGRVPITAKLVANLLTTAGADRILCMDLHATQIQGFFDIPVDHLYAAPVHLAHLRELAIDNLTVLSPDPGRIKMAYAFAKRLGAGLAVIDKRRTGDSEVERGHVVGDLKDRNVLIVDDMISTAGSVAQAVLTAVEFGAKSVRVMAVHAVFCGRALERLSALPIADLCVTDSIPIRKAPENISMTVLSVAPLLAEGIKRTHRNESISKLFVN